MTNSTEKVALEPCPFCGREARIGKVNRLRQGICYHCEAAGPLCETEAGAAHAWNTRAITTLTEPSEAMLDAGEKTYLTPPNGVPRTHRELCRQIYAAMTRSSTSGSDQ